MQLFQTMILGIQPLVFGGVFEKLRNQKSLAVLIHVENSQNEPTRGNHCLRRLIQLQIERICFLVVSKMFGYFHPYLGEMIQFDYIFFKWVETTN